MSHIDFATEVLARPYRRVLTPDEGGGYTATIHEFPGLAAEGESADEALANLEAAARTWLETATATGYPIAAPVDFNGCSGKIALRLTRGLHKVVAERADLEGTSINQLLNVAIATYMGQAQGLQKAYTQLQDLCNEVVYFSRHETSKVFTTYPEIQIAEWRSLSNTTRAVTDPAIALEHRSSHG